MEFKDAQIVLANGGNVIMNKSWVDLDEAKALAATAKAAGSQLTLVGYTDPTEAAAIGASGKGHVTFDNASHKARE